MKVIFLDVDFDIKEVIMFIEYSKRSKKEQKKANNLARKLWGITKPITKVIPSKKLYNRKAGWKF